MKYNHRIGRDRLFGNPFRASSSGALAAGAVAIGACAIGAVAIGSLAIRRMRIGNLSVDALNVGQMRVANGLEAATRTVAEGYVALCREGEFEEAMARFFSEDHVRLESVDMIAPPTETHGMEEMRQRSREFAKEEEIHGVEIDGPFVGGERFAVRFSIDSTARPTGQRTTIRKLDLYTARDGRIVRSEVYYNTPPLPAR